MNAKVEMGDIFCPRGLPSTRGNRYVVMGMPKLKGQWITVARDVSGAVHSFPLDEFHERFYQV